MLCLFKNSLFESPTQSGFNRRNASKSARIPFIVSRQKLDPLTLAHKTTKKAVEVVFQVPLIIGFIS